jgi:hypothetical protein
MQSITRESLGKAIKQQGCSIGLETFFLERLSLVMQRVVYIPIK